MSQKHFHYAQLISMKIQEIFDEESDIHIDQKELLNDDNLTDFIHALANVSPTFIFNHITGDKKNQIEFNHIANQLCFQYSNRNSDGDDKALIEALQAKVEKLEERDNWLRCLEAAGVDNWEGYGIAIDLRDKDSEE